MNAIRVPHSGTMSQLGCGCTVLKGGPERADQMGLLSAAYNPGIRHYDIAPRWRLGVAEGILGEFLRGRRSLVTVTGKVNLQRPRNPSALCWHHSPARTASRSIAE